jgi:hypothetical protein
MDYFVTNPGGHVGWNLLHPPNPGVAGSRIVNPAQNAPNYLCFGMNQYAAVNAHGQYFGLFTKSLCGCFAGFLVRTNGNEIRRIAGYHYTSNEAVYEGAVLLFNQPGPTGPAPGDVNYAITPDTNENYRADLPDRIALVVGPNRPIPRDRWHSYRRPQGPGPPDHLSWVISLNGDMGEMNPEFDGSLTPEQAKRSRTLMGQPCLAT